MAANLGYLFYREYYKDYFTEKPYEKGNGENDSDFKKRQRGHFESKNNKVFNASKQIVKNEFQLLGSDADLQYTTTYPGVLIGSGYAFGTGLEGEFKLGFYFDHTTGMPVIPGSSVKGLLRSVFPGFTALEVKYQFNEDAKDDSGRYVFVDTEKKKLRTDLLLKKEKALFTWWLLFQEEKQHLTVTEYRKLYDIEEAIFESMVNGEPLPIYKRDIFHDAYIVESRHSDKRVLGSDFITPHKHTGNPRRPELDPFSNPVPIMFMKVLPNVVFQFCFDLKNHGLDAAEKEALFKRIIETLGAGAKTNVGYGQLKPTNNHGQNRQGQPASRTTTTPIGEPENYTGKIKKGNQLQAKVISGNLAYCILNNEKKEYSTAKHHFPAGTLLIVEIVEAVKGEIKMLRAVKPIQN